MRIVVLGQSGQVATELARATSRRGIDARFFGRESADLSAPGAAAAAIGPWLEGADAVINAAAWTGVDQAEAEEAAARALNAEMPGEAARAAAEAGVPFLHVSTDYVFDGSGSAPWRPGDAPAPLGAYGRTKLGGEDAVARAGGTHAILRTSWVFSAHGANFVKTMLRVGAERASLRIVGDQVGGPTPAAAIAEALVTMARALAEGEAQSGIWHLSGAPDVSWAGFAREIFVRAGMRVAVEEIATADWPTPAARPRNSRLDCAGLAATFGLRRPDWRPAIDDVLDELGQI